MRIAVLFDGAGLVRLGLEQAGHECIGYEVDPYKHWLSSFTGSGNCVCQDITTVNLSSFDAVWCSPPYQTHCELNWYLALKDQVEILWIENIFSKNGLNNDWGNKWNTNQFSRLPLQNRIKIIGGKHEMPLVFRGFNKDIENVCPTIITFEYENSDRNNAYASRHYKKCISIKECAYYQGLFKIPDGWFVIPDWFPEMNDTKWNINLHEAISESVPVYMAKRFGKAYKC